MKLGGSRAGTKRGLRLLACVPGLATVLLASAVPAAQAAFSGKNGRIAFDVGGEIQTIAPDGSGRTTLTSGSSPSWSADGAKLAFSDPTTHQIFTINADGSERIQITNEYLCNDPPNCFGGLSSPSFSPTGRQVAYTVSVGGGRDSFFFIDVADIDTGVISGFVDFAFSPAWSPDGGKIAYEGPNGGIRVASPDGTNRVELTQGVDEYPSWSPDGTKIAFTHIDYIHGIYGIYTIDADGSNPTRITDQLDFQPAWSPDGTKIAFSRYHETSPDLFTMNADGTGQVDITPGTPVSEYRPNWQPVHGPQRADYKNAAQFCKALREFLGDEAFRSRYGSGANAHGKCVSGGSR
jgi:Tol biopolymer transport system component